MKGFHGIIFAYSAAPELGTLANSRTAASLPFCGRYRLIDFALSSLKNAGVLDVGVIMQRDYQSLLDHIGSSKAWDMSRKSGGLRMLPPFGLPVYHNGHYTGTMEALNGVHSYIEDIPQDNIVLLLGNMVANIDLTAAMKHHLASGAEMTAICADHAPTEAPHRYVIGENGFVETLFFNRSAGYGMPSMEGYIVSKKALISLMEKCRSLNLHRFHRDAVSLFLRDGGKMSVYVHEGYARAIRTVEDYYIASMDMLCKDKRAQVFPKDRPVRSKHVEGVSSYYSETASSRNSLVADNCIIEGSIENCIIFPRARIAKGAKLKNCIIMQGGIVGEGAQLQQVIADKYVSFAPGANIAGSTKLPFVAPKSSKI